MDSEETNSQKKGGKTKPLVIALVITIIVLLILAGVIILLVMGDNEETEETSDANSTSETNRTLTQAIPATDNTNEANVTSALEMALQGISTEYLADKYTDGNSTAYSVTLDSYVTKASLQEELDEDFTVIKCVVDKESGTEIEYENKTYIFTVGLSSSGNGFILEYEGVE